MTTNATLADVASYGNLLIAHAHARRGKGYYQSVKVFEENKTALLHELETSLLNGTFRTSPYHHKTITDSGKEREIAKLPYFPDRIVHWAIMLQLESAFIRAFSTHTHAAISGRGIHTALHQTRKFLLEHPEETRYCLKIDVQKYFPHINHTVLKHQVRSLTQDKGLLALLDENIDSTDTGVPIGNYTSQYYANLYLSPLDRWLEQRNINYVRLHVRYMDDICIFGKSAAELHQLHRELEWFMSRNLYLTIKPNWQVFPTAVRGIDFVGYRIFPNRVMLRKSTFANMRRNLSAVRRHLEEGKYSDSDRSSIASYSGWIMHCTPKVRQDLFERYIMPLIDMLPESDSKFKKKLLKRYNHDRKNQNLHHRRPSGKSACSRQSVLHL